MPRRLDAILLPLRRAPSLPALDAAIRALRDRYGAAHVVYHALGPGGRQWAATTYPQAWVEAYTAAGSHIVDPVVRACFDGHGPIEWKTLDWSPRPARALLGEAVAAGIGNQGLSLPVRGPGGQFAVLTVNDRAPDGAWSRFAREHADELVLVAHALNEAALALAGAPPATPRALSPREADALSMLAAGRSRAQAADALGLSEHTLRAYLEGARLKLGAHNTVHAVASALARGMIAL